MVRTNLINARKAANLTQAETAEKIGILPTSYQNIEYGTRKGSIEVWDALEDLFGIPQRQLRDSAGAATPDSTKTPDGNQAK